MSLTVKGLSVARAEPVNFLGMKAPENQIKKDFESYPT
jgi:hypothetical protein